MMLCSGYTLQIMKSTLQHVKLCALIAQCRADMNNALSLVHLPAEVARSCSLAPNAQPQTAHAKAM